MVSTRFKTCVLSSKFQLVIFRGSLWNSKLRQQSNSIKFDHFFAFNSVFFGKELNSSQYSTSHVQNRESSFHRTESIQPSSLSLLVFGNEDFWAKPRRRVSKMSTGKKYSKRPKTLKNVFELHYKKFEKHTRQATKFIKTTVIVTDYYEVALVLVLETIGLAQTFQRQVQRKIEYHHLTNTNSVRGILQVCTL